jgi:hypothetical protein
MKKNDKLVGKFDSLYGFQGIIYANEIYNIHYVNQFGGAEVGIKFRDIERDIPSGFLVTYFSRYELERYFYTAKELRKNKLNKINGKIYK